MKRHFNIQIYGLVQGVFFRATAKEQADKLGLMGFAENILPSEDCFPSENRSDGSVYIEVEGKENNLNRFVKWCNIGPLMAQVEKVLVTEDKLKNFSGFEVY